MGGKTPKCFPAYRAFFLFLFFVFFWQSVYWSVPIPQNLPSAEKILIAHLPSGTILFARHSILSVWQCSECDLMLCTTSECTTSDIFRILAYSELCLFRYMQNYSIILNIIKAYSCILKHFWGIYMHIQHPVQPSHIQKLTKFSALVYLELASYPKPCETLIRHIRNSAIIRTLP